MEPDFPGDFDDSGDPSPEEFEGDFDAPPPAPPAPTPIQPPPTPIQPPPPPIQPPPAPIQPAPPPLAATDSPVPVKPPRKGPQPLSREQASHYTSAMELRILPFVELVALAAQSDSTGDFNKREVQRQAAMALCRIDVPKKRAEAMMDQIDLPFAPVPLDLARCSAVMNDAHPISVRAAGLEYACVQFYVKGLAIEEELDLAKRAAEALFLPRETLARILQRVARCQKSVREKLDSDEALIYRTLGTNHLADPEKHDVAYRKICVQYHPLRSAQLPPDERKQAFIKYVSATIALGKLKRAL